MTPKKTPTSRAKSNGGSTGRKRATPIKPVDESDSEENVPESLLNISDDDEENIDSPSAGRGLSATKRARATPKRSYAESNSDSSNESTAYVPEAKKTKVKHEFEDDADGFGASCATEFEDVENEV